MKLISLLALIFVFLVPFCFGSFGSKYYPLEWTVTGWQNGTTTAVPSPSIAIGEKYFVLVSRALLSWSSDKETWNRKPIKELFQEAGFRYPSNPFEQNSIQVKYDFYRGRFVLIVQPLEPSLLPQPSAVREVIFISKTEDPSDGWYGVQYPSLITTSTDPSVPFGSFAFPFTLRFTMDRDNVYIVPLLRRFNKILSVKEYLSFKKILSTMVANLNLLWVIFDRKTISNTRWQDGSQLINKNKMNNIMVL
eukprot:TRINITY_DN6146_c0_g1_i1.p1 TRINITY_DN6146_c0_g1~~TRINITY_DN6146_c0_g1_i1.p1  ORF type:complete len:249 (-),score=30.47 TRINITY_DN6146_c0_g1_i1:206-952(-)